MNKTLLIGVGALVVLGAIAFFATQRAGYQAPTSPPAGGLTTTEVTEEEATPGAEEEVREIEVSGDEYSFSPNSISLTAGEKVKVTFKNGGSLPHNFTIAELGVASKTIAAGKEDAVTFQVEESGDYTFFCGVGNHRALGMEGDLTISQ